MEARVLKIIRNSIMNTIVKFTSRTLLLAIVAFYSCKKEPLTTNSNGTNKPPIANAGPDQVISPPQDSTVLDGGASTDPDGNIVSYEWRVIAGPSL